MKSLKGAPGHIGWLMQHELRVFWRSGKGMPKSGLIFLGLIALLPAILSPAGASANGLQMQICSGDGQTRALAIPAIDAGWFGGNIVVEGIPDLTLLPPSARLRISAERLRCI